VDAAQKNYAEHAVYNQEKIDVINTILDIIIEKLVKIKIDLMFGDS